MNGPRAADGAACTLAALLLEQGRAVHRLSCVLTGLSLAGLGLAGVTDLPRVSAFLLAAAALLGAAEAYLAVRVGFDAAIFRLVAMENAGWQDVDGALARLNLTAPQDAPRSFGSRAKGALRLLRRQGIAIALQLLSILAALTLQA